MVSMFIIGCEEDEDTTTTIPDSNSLITATKSVISIEWNGPGLENVVTVDDNIILNLGNSVITKQRDSCSGFDIATMSDISVTDIVEYTYYTDGEGTDLTIRTIAPLTAKFFRYECVYVEPTDQWIHDEDRDGYTDNIDAYPNDPTRH